MALGFYAGDTQVSINHSEEYLLEMACKNPEEFSELTKIWEGFYDDPGLTSE